MTVWTFDDDEAIKRITGLIVYLRGEAGLSIVELAGEAGISENTVKLIQKRKSYPTLPVILRICRVLEIPAWEFFLSVENYSPSYLIKLKELLGLFERLTPGQRDLLIYIAKNLNG